MKITNVKDFKNKATTYLKADEPTLVIRHGKLAGLLLPLQNTDNLPEELRMQLLTELSHIDNFKTSGIKDKKKNKLGIIDNEV